jgi:hypothetical protein
MPERAPQTVLKRFCRSALLRHLGLLEVQLGRGVLLAVEVVRRQQLAAAPAAAAGGVVGGRLGVQVAQAHARVEAALADRIDGTRPLHVIAEVQKRHGETSLPRW